MQQSWSFRVAVAVSFGIVVADLVVVEGDDDLLGRFLVDALIVFDGFVKFLLVFLNLLKFNLKFNIIINTIKVTIINVKINAILRINIF